MNQHSSTPPLLVTRPVLPPLDRFIPYLEQIWSSGILTNGGPLHQLLEARLAEYLGVPYVSLFNNGTIALLVALRVLNLEPGEVITTPYSFVATANAVRWAGLEPVFADVDPISCNLAPDSIRRSITPKTRAILPVHCYGQPCDVEAIAAISAEYGLPVVYDAAHAFGVKCHCGESLLIHGDLSVLSFHATKVFHTFEGGAIVSHSRERKDQIDKLKNFGFLTETEVEYSGINGKVPEVSCAIGLVQLESMHETLAARASVAEAYNRGLHAIKGLRLLVNANQVSNNAYYPVFVEPEFPLSRDALYERLKGYGIFSRRYFYPLIPNFSAYRIDGNWPNARKLADRVLCLPMYAAMIQEDVQRVVSAIVEIANGRMR